MDGSESNAQQETIQKVSRPASVTVFGIFNLIFGVMGLMCSPISIYGMLTAGEQMQFWWPYKVFLLVMNVIGFGFSIWLFILGMGLLKICKWARRGTVLYAALAVLYSVFETAMNIVALSVGWMKIPEEAVTETIVSTIIGLCGGLIYPILLLIFMQTEKVKRAFAAIGG